MEKGKDNEAKNSLGLLLSLYGFSAVVFSHAWLDNINLVHQNTDFFSFTIWTFLEEKLFGINSIHDYMGGLVVNCPPSRFGGAAIDRC